MDERVEIVRRNLKPDAQIPMVWISELIEAYDELAGTKKSCPPGDHFYQYVDGTYRCTECPEVF